MGTAKPRDEKTDWRNSCLGKDKIGTVNKTLIFHFGKCAFQRTWNLRRNSIGTRLFF